MHYQYILLIILFAAFIPIEVWRERKMREALREDRPRGTRSYFTYDRKARMGYLYLNGKDPETEPNGVYTKEIAPGAFGDFDEKGGLIGIELFDGPETK
jgi:uncharacterized protein YuzE